MFKYVRKNALTIGDIVFSNISSTKCKKKYDTNSIFQISADVIENVQ